MRARITTIFMCIILLTFPFTLVAAAYPNSPNPGRGQENESMRKTGKSNGLSYTTSVYAMLGEPETLDPALAYNTTDARVLLQIYEPLLFYNRGSATEFVPMLAGSWSISTDGKTYTFTIRPGVRFHNGNDLTPEDVAYSLQRGILQGGTASPQWLFTQPLLGEGIDDISLLVDPNGSLYDDRAGMIRANRSRLTAACQTVKNAILADNAAGTVTLNLQQAWDPMLYTLTGSWGSVMDKEWIIQQGGWDGSCDTWQNYYAMQAEEDPFSRMANGTGPFKLDSWTPGVEISLSRYPSYWRQSPIWPGGPSGPAVLEKVLFKDISSTATGKSMLINGDADFVELQGGDESDLLSQVLWRYDQPDGIEGTYVHPTGTLSVYNNILSPSSIDAFLNFQISTGGPRNYIGSGTFDGNGVPQDFFSDIHVRKAFNYAFDWSDYIQTAFLGSGVQRRGPIPKGILGYKESQPTYTHNPTLAMQEFSQAWGGQVVSNGFVLTLSYNEGNLTRQAAANVLKKNIEALDPKFHINVLELTWEEYLADQRDRYLPIFISGWMQDIPHPYNWVVPYLVGTYARRQNLPENMISAYFGKIQECIALLGSGAQTCFEQLQNQVYLDAPDIFLAQAITRHFVRAEVKGYYASTAFVGPYFYAISKSPLPEVFLVTPESAQTINLQNESGATASILLPAGTVSETVQILANADASSTGAPSGYHLGSFVFDLVPFAGSEPIDSFTFTEPVTITLQYNTETAGSLFEDSLKLFWWSGNDWEDAACGPYTRDLEQNILQVPICHLSKFALGGQSNDLFLPLVGIPLP